MKHYEGVTGDSSGSSPNKYLEPQMGSPSRQIQAMARRELRLELRTMLREAIAKRHTIVRERVEVQLDERVQVVRITVQPFIQGDQERLYLIVFTDLGRPLSREEVAQPQPRPADGDAAGLEHELRETRDRLQATIEEYETALEELKSGNEELVSVNEELNTVNNELASKVDELDPSDRGRPILDIAHQLVAVDFAHDVRRVLDEQTPIERPVRLRNGKVFHLMRILPYRTTEDHIDGVLVTLVNVTDIVAAEEQLRTLVSELNHRVRNMLQVVIGLANGQ